MLRYLAISTVIVLTVAVIVAGWMNRDLIRIKIASAAGEILNAMPEYEDCRRAAREHAVALRAVMEAALAAYGELSSVKAKR